MGELHGRIGDVGKIEQFRGMAVVCRGEGDGAVFAGVDGVDVEAVEIDAPGFAAERLEPEGTVGAVGTGEQERVVVGHPGGSGDVAIEGIGCVGADSAGDGDDVLGIFVAGLAIARERVGDARAIGGKKGIGLLGGCRSDAANGAGGNIENGEAAGVGIAAER